MELHGAAHLTRDDDLTLRATDIFSIFMCISRSDPGGSRACNPWLRRLIPYPLGHRALEACAYRTVVQHSIKFDFANSGRLRTKGIPNHENTTDISTPHIPSIILFFETLREYSKHGQPTCVM